jgi:hypothetical protein
VILLLLYLTVARADPRAVAAGDDLEAWQALRAQRPSPGQEDWLHFIVAFPQSPLAERSWLIALEYGEIPESWRRAHRAIVRDLERSIATHEEQLSRIAEPGPVVRLDQEGHLPDLRLRWEWGTRVGAGLDPRGIGGILGVSARRGGLTLLIRGIVSPNPHAEVSVRASPPPWGPVFAEVGLDSLLRIATRAGIQARIRGPWSVDASVGAAWAPYRPDPQLKLELSWAPRR